MFDVYRHKIDARQRIATAPGAGMPNHINAEDWELMPAGTSQIIEDAARDIEARGFCFFRLIER
jgi:hypothetical protein